MKKFLTIVLTIFVLLSLVACNDNSDNNDDSNVNKQQNYNWEDIYVKAILPEPSSKEGKILSNENDYLDINIYNTSLDEYNAYIDSCEDYGFEIEVDNDSDENEYECEGYNKYHSELHISYSVDRRTMHIKLSAIIENNPLQWSNSALAKMLPVPSSAKGYIDADREEKYEVVLMDVSISDFNSYVSECIAKGFTEDAQQYSTYYRAKNADGYRVTIELGEMDREMGITIIVPET